MKHRVLVSAVPFLACLAFLHGCNPSGSHSHEKDTPPSAAAELEPETHTVFGERALLFMEHPRLVRGRAARFLAHLSVSATGEPVRAGRVTLEIGTAKLAVDAPKRDGLFVPEGVLPESGKLRARLTVAGAQVEEVIDLGEIEIHADDQAALQASMHEDGPEPANAIPFLMEQQWRVKLLLSESKAVALSKRLTIPAEARLPEGAAAVVAPPTSGRLFAPPSGRLPRTGDRVEAQQLLGLIEPPLVASDLAQLQALRLDLELKVLESARAVGEADARLRFAELEVERQRQLRGEGLSTRPQLDSAEQSLSVARSDSAAAHATKDSLDRLVADRAARDEGASAAAVRLPLRSPIAGTIVASMHVEGESVGADAEIFRVVDASRLWIEGRVSEFDMPELRAAPAAFVSFPALPDRRIEISEAAVSGAYISSTIEPGSRTFVIRYELPNPTGELKAGMLAQLELATERVNAKTAIPFESVIVDQGLPTAYVMLSGETFQKRELELGIRDGGLVEVRRGIAPGERVATRGSYLIKLAALSPASFGPGHAH